MKMILLLSLLFPSILLASETTFCNNDGDRSVVTISDSNFNLTVNGVENPLTIQLYFSTSGEEAQVDAALIGEAVKGSTAYKLANAKNEEVLLAVIEGISGNSYLIDILTGRTLGSTDECKN
jgi:hypothetical protein